jgi:hypothetical protein
MVPTSWLLERNSSEQPGPNFAYEHLKGLKKLEGNVTPVKIDPQNHPWFFPCGGKLGQQLTAHLGNQTHVLTFVMGPGA